MSDVALLTSGRDAKGHGFYIDERTIETALEVIVENGGKLQAKICHDNFEEWWLEIDRLMEMPGWFESISKGSIDGEAALISGRFSFYETFLRDHSSEASLLLEMAEKTPDLFGLSIEPWGYAVFVALDGTEYSQKPEDVELRYEGMPAFRVTDLRAAAFVSDPAANSGLFAQLSSFFGKKRSKGVDALSRLIPALENFSAPSAGNTNQNQTDMIEQLKKKFGDDEARLSRALLLHANNPKDSIEEIEKKLKAQDEAENLKAITEERDTLKTEKTALEEQLKTANTEKEDLQKKYDDLKDSGFTGGLNTGTAGSGVPTVNPFAEGSVNLTEQIRLKKENPTLAATLEAQAKGLPAPAPEKKDA